MENMLIYHLALFLIGIMFFLSAMNISLNWQSTLNMVQAKGLPFAKAGLFLVLLLKFFAGLMLIFNFHVQLAATSLLIFVAIVTLLFHNFWSLQGRERMNRYFAFCSNLCIMGGLLMVVISH